MLQRAVEQKAVGSLGYAAELLKAQKQGKEIFPVESRGKHYFIMPRTRLLDRHGLPPRGLFLLGRRGLGVGVALLLG